MLEVKKENLDLKINSKAIEDHRKDFLMAVTQGRLRWKNEKEYLEKQLMEAKEEIDDLKGKLRLKESILEKVSSRARSPSVMPKKEREAVVDKVMEDVTMRNEIRATALLVKRLKDQNEELDQKNLELVEENNMMKLKIGELQACATFDMETRLKTLQEARQKIEKATNQAGISKAMEEDVVREFRLPSFKWQEKRPRDNSVSTIKEKRPRSEVVKVGNVRSQTDLKRKMIVVAEGSGRRR